MDAQTRPNWLPFLIAVAIALATALTAAARDRRSDPPRELATLAERVAGGAALLSQIDSSRDADDFRDLASRFEESANRGRFRRSAARDWREVRDAWAQVRRRLNTRDGRAAFLATHLDLDVTSTDRLMANAGDWDDDRGGNGDDDYGSSGQPASGKLALIDRETCVGTQSTDHACPSRRSSTISFRLPNDVTAIRRMDAEWRDYGRPAEAQLYVNDRMVWKSDVNKDWDGDGTSLDVRVPEGSTISIRSSTGDPIWIRKLSLDVVRDASSDDDRRYRNPWDF